MSKPVKFNGLVNVRVPDQIADIGGGQQPGKQKHIGRQRMTTRTGPRRRGKAWLGNSLPVSHGLRR